MPSFVWFIAYFHFQSSSSVFFFFWQFLLTLPSLSSGAVNFRDWREWRDWVGETWQQGELSLDSRLAWVWGCKRNQHFSTVLDKLSNLYDFLNMFPEESGLSWINTGEDVETSMETSTGKGIRTTHVLSSPSPVLLGSGAEITAKCSSSCCEMHSNGFVIVGIMGMYAITSI